MDPIPVVIEDVVDEIDAAGQCAKDDEGRAGEDEERGAEGVLREDEPGKDEQILDPLPGAKGADYEEEHDRTTIAPGRRAVNYDPGLRTGAPG